MPHRNQSPEDHFKILHINCRSPQDDQSLHAMNLCQLFEQLTPHRLTQKQVVVGSDDPRGKIGLKEDKPNNAPLSSYVINNLSLIRKWPRHHPASIQFRKLIRIAVKDFTPDLVHVHQARGLTPSIIGNLKARFDMPVIISLYDYGCICPTGRLINYKGEPCKDTAHGDNCVICYNSHSPVAGGDAPYRYWPGEFESHKFMWCNALEHADRIIAISSELKKHYDQHAMAPGKISVITNDGNPPMNMADYARDISALYNELFNDKKTTGCNLELGGGETPNRKNNNFLNIDFRATPAVDVVADVGELPFGKRAIDQIFAANLVEHFSRKEIQYILLGWWRSIKQGGWADIVVPDLEGTLDNWRNMPFHRVLDALYGAQKFKGDYHYNGFTAETLKQLLVNSGFHSFPISMHYELMDVPRLFMRARKRTRIRIYPFGDASKASARLRIHNIYPHLVKMGYDVRLFGDPGDCDVAIFQKVFDQKLVDRCKGVTILDLDDNFFEFTNSASICQQISNRVSAIVTSTATLKRTANKYSKAKVTIIPTSVDISGKDIDAPIKTSAKIKRAGWVGNPENLHYLDPILPLLKAVGIKLRIITRASQVDPHWLEKNHAHIELYEWTIDGADDLLRGCDVGVAPLKSDNWSTCKSAVKILKYWSLGIPVICSSAPEYRRIADEFGVACIAQDRADWLQQLNSPPDERDNQVRTARKSLGGYVAPSVADQWSELVEQLVYEDQLKHGTKALHEKR